MKDRFTAPAVNAEKVRSLRLLGFSNEELELVVELFEAAAEWEEGISRSHGDIYPDGFNANNDNGRLARASRATRKVFT